MNDIKSVVAKNIADLRQAKGMTQLELGEKLNYSDKAVSKWEHADSMPDISVLVEISDLFGVSLDSLVKDEHITQSEVITKHSKKNQHIIITAVSILAVWFIAVASFAFLCTCLKPIRFKWLTFIYAVPISSILWLIFNSIWFNRRMNYVIISLMQWSLLTAFYLTFLAFEYNIWMFYIVGIPGQVIILLLSLMKKTPKNR